MKDPFAIRRCKLCLDTLSFYPAAPAFYHHDLSVSLSPYDYYYIPAEHCSYTHRALYTTDTLKLMTCSYIAKE